MRPELTMLWGRAPRFTQSRLSGASADVHSTARSANAAATPSAHQRTGSARTSGQTLTIRKNVAITRPKLRSDEDLISSGRLKSSCVTAADLHCRGVQLRTTCASRQNKLAASLCPDLAPVFLTQSEMRKK